jgi:hypothetical protein
MRKASIQNFVRDVESRKQAVGMTDGTIALARNSGLRRKAEKREMISRIQDRARAAGLEPLQANF